MTAITPAAEQEEFDELVGEIVSLLQVRSLTAVAQTPTPTLDGLAGWPGQATVAERCVALSALLEDAAVGIDSPSMSAAASALVRRFGEFRSEKERASEAGQALGVSYDAFRRKGPDGESHRARVIAALAGVLVSRLAPDSATAGPGGRTKSRPGIGLVARVAVLGTIAVGGLLVATHGSNPSSSDAQQPNTATTAPPSKIELSTSTTVAVIPSTTSEQTTTLSSDISVFAGDPLLSDAELPCEYDPGQPGQLNAPDAGLWSQQFRGKYDELGGIDTLGCPASAMDLDGDSWWQYLRKFDRHNGGLLGIPGLGVLWLNRGEWVSFEQASTRLGGRGRALENVGIPSEQPREVDGIWILDLEPTGTMIASEIDGHYTLVSPAIATSWAASGGLSGPYGAPTSLQDLDAAGVSQGFETGTLSLSPAGEVVWKPWQESDSKMPSADSLRGHLISQIDGTGWLVDDSLRRWWIPDGQVWTCAGGGRNIAAGDFEGPDVGTLEYGGVMTCPTSDSGVTAAGGDPALTDFCRAEVSALTHGEYLESGDPVCANDMVRAAIDRADVCRWQYAPEATVAVDPTDSTVWWCET